MSSIAYQTLYCPFQSTMSPHADTIDQHTLTWAYSFGLIPSHSASQRFQDAHFGWLAAYLAPSASLESLQLLSDWNTWAILWDDVCDQPAFSGDPERLRHDHTIFLNVLRGNLPVDAGSPFVKALWNIRQRLAQRSSQFQLHQFVRHVKEFFAGYVWEATNRAQQRSVDVANYISMRRFTSGMYTSLKVVEIVDQIRLPNKIWRCQIVTCLRERATNAVCWANDIISLDQEARRGEIHNLIMVLQDSYDYPLPRAIELAVHLHDAEVVAFQMDAARVPSFGPTIDAHVERYILLLRSFMYGNLAWSAMTGRYGLAQEEQAYALGEVHAPPHAHHHELLMRTKLHSGNSS